MQRKTNIDEATKETIKNELHLFCDYVRYKNGKTNTPHDHYIDFRDTLTFPGNEEEYKVEVATMAKGKLCSSEWDESWIGTGKISEYVRRAVAVKNQNLVNSYQQMHLQDCCNPNSKKYRSDSERALFDIYCGSDDEEAFKQAVKTFGASYDLIAYLFYIKEPEKYLPIHSRSLEKGLKYLGIEYSLAKKCSWDNYDVFIKIIGEIQQIMNEHLPLKEKNSVRLIDAHSFVWIISQDAYVDWPHEYEYAIEMGLCNNNYQMSKADTVRKSTKSVTSYNRNSAVAQRAKKQADGICQLCGNPAPFKDEHDQPYLEAHHIQWLSQGGKDADDNVVALCPNCHRKMHVINDFYDRQKLLALKNRKNHNQ